MQNWFKWTITLLILGSTIAACSVIDRAAAPPSPTLLVSPSPAGGDHQSGSSSQPAGREIAGSDEDLVTVTPGQLSPDDARETPSPADSLSNEQQSLFDRLAAAAPPVRDELEVARLYLGWDGTIDPTPAVESPLAVGTIQQINVLNHDTKQIAPIEAELLAVSQHGYFWFDTAAGFVRPTSSELEPIGRRFDEIYEQSVALFGQENRPGIDGDPRLHVVNASPPAVCDVAMDATASCGIAGYFSSFDGLPKSVDPDSNAREMFVMNGEQYNTTYYLNTLAHELRHMIEDNYDRGDADWVSEGTAVLAEDLLGFSGNGINLANLFLKQPDQQLNRWPDGNTHPYYGQGYLLNRYIYDRLGLEGYRQFITSPADGLLAIDAATEAGDQPLSGEALWLDWLAALAIHDDGGAAEKYHIQALGLDTAAMQELNRYPVTITETVRQYAADYYQLSGDETVTLAFTGNPSIPLIDAEPASGETMWLANRANFSHMQLTGQFDLTGVESATLEYDVYHDIEQGYDFAYLFVSEDGGQSWQALAAENMQGLGPEDDPSRSALSEGFYTGRSDGWRSESVDLSAYAGQTIQLRFAYLTDPILTFGGLAVDNIAIPEINFVDGDEIDSDGWQAEGFERVTATIPQHWHLQLITFPDGAPLVESLTLKDGQTLSHRLSLQAAGNKAILIVAASAPMTLEPASYELVVGE